MLMELAQSIPSDGGGSGDLITIVYVLTAVSLIAGFIIGTYKYVGRQKKKWTEEGITRQKQSQAVAENTQQMIKNTEAIGNLSLQFSDFASSVRQELSRFGQRLGDLESWRRDQTHPK